MTAPKQRKVNEIHNMMQPPRINSAYDPIYQEIDNARRNALMAYNAGNPYSAVRDHFVKAYGKVTQAESPYWSLQAARRCAMDALSCGLINVSAAFAEVVTKFETELNVPQPSPWWMGFGERSAKLQLS